MESSKIVSIVRYNGTNAQTIQDEVAVEEPLEITLISGSDENQQASKISITMRTPGEDSLLAIGFLFTEGIINHISDIESVKYSHTLPGIESNYIEVTLRKDLIFNKEVLNRNFYTTSSCGVCGKASIDAIKTVPQFAENTDNKQLHIHPEVLYGLQETLRNHQIHFKSTGGIHAAAIFSPSGELIEMSEDVGRHNALDKLIGKILHSQQLPASENILLLSGRGSFELLQKAGMAGIKIVCAVGAPSSLAVQTAEELGITLVGFLKSDRLNIYSHPERISI